VAAEEPAAVAGRADFVELWMHHLGTADRGDAVAVLAVEDEDAANRSSSRLLITAATQPGVATLARRIHAACPRTQFPFVHTWAGGLPVGPELLKEYCAPLPRMRDGVCFDGS
jgi:hypothetical protein